MTDEDGERHFRSDYQTLASADKDDRNQEDDYHSEDPINMCNITDETSKDLGHIKRRVGSWDDSCLAHLPNKRKSDSSSLPVPSESYNPASKSINRSVSIHKNNETIFDSRAQPSLAHPVKSVSVAAPTAVIAMAPRVVSEGKVSDSVSQLVRRPHRKLPVNVAQSVPTSIYMSSSYSKSNSNKNINVDNNIDIESWEPSTTVCVILGGMGVESGQGPTAGIGLRASLAIKGSAYGLCGPRVGVKSIITSNNHNNSNRDNNNSNSNSSNNSYNNNNNNSSSTVSSVPTKRPVGSSVQLIQTPSIALEMKNDLVTPYSNLGGSSMNMNIVPLPAPEIFVPKSTTPALSNSFIQFDSDGDDDW